jgi:3-oxoadipate enol-lactonase
MSELPGHERAAGASRAMAHHGTGTEWLCGVDRSLLVLADILRGASTKGIAAAVSEAIDGGASAGEIHDVGKILYARGAATEATLRTLAAAVEPPPHPRAIERPDGDHVFLDLGRPAGSPVVLLHPLGLDHRAWLPLATRLAVRHRVVVPDLQGHGIGARGRTLTSVAGAAEELMLLTEALGLSEFVLVGLSMGGAVAQEIAASRSDRLRGLALLGTFPRGQAAFLQRAEQAQTESREARIGATLARWFRPMDLGLNPSGVRYARAMLETTDAHAWAAAWRALAGFDASGRLGHIAVPTLCISGSLDTSTPPPVLASIAAAIPGQPPSWWKVLRT